MMFEPGNLRECIIIPLQIRKICVNVSSMDPVSGGFPQYPGIQHLHLRTFLLTDI